MRYILLIMNSEAPLSYRPRIVDEELRARLGAAGAVVIEGAKATGKTETAKQLAASSVLLDVDEAARQAMEVDPKLVLEGQAPRLVDEWQVEPKVWSHVRRMVDDRRIPGQFILTGSAVPNEDVNQHTGAGRFSFLRMRPMTLFETGHSSGAISLEQVMRGQLPSQSDPGMTVADIAERIAVGGWPGQLGRSPTDARRAVRDYLEQIQRVDVGRVAGGHRDPQKVGQLVRSLARNVATEVTTTVLAKDAAGPDASMSRNTVISYLEILERLMIIENQPAWAPHLRSKAILRSSPKRHFVDPSLAAAALGASPERLLADISLLGFFFESLVIRELRVFAQRLNGTVSHYRDNNDLEVDAIVELDDGRWAAFEVKLGTSRIDEGAASLLRFAQVVDTERCGPPSMLAVVTSSGYGYVRDDGVGVIPLGLLGP